MILEPTAAMTETLSTAMAVMTSAKLSLVSLAMAVTFKTQTSVWMFVEMVKFGTVQLLTTATMETQTVETDAAQHATSRLDGLVEVALHQVLIPALKYVVMDLTLEPMDAMTVIILILMVAPHCVQLSPAGNALEALQLILIPAQKFAVMA